MLSIFYTRKEIATRISILYTGNILATAFAGLIAAGIFHGMDNLAGISGWQWLFILQGAVTFLIAVLSIFTLPDDPLVTRWLTEEERTLAHERIVADTVGARHQTSTFSGLKEAARDPKIWLFAFMQHMHLAANGFKNFFPTAVETLGFSTTITLVLTCPPYLIAGLISVVWSWSSGRFNERTWHITIAKAIAIFGFILGCATLNTGARYFAMVVFAIGTYAVNSIVLGWVSSTCGQTKEKKASSLAIVNTIANASFVWTPVCFLFSFSISTMVNRIYGSGCADCCSISGPRPMNLGIRWPCPRVLRSRLPVRPVRGQWRCGLFGRIERFARVMTNRCYTMLISYGSVVPTTSSITTMYLSELYVLYTKASLGPRFHSLFHIMSLSYSQWS